MPRLFFIMQYSFGHENDANERGTYGTMTNTRIITGSVTEAE
jgi:hypothetical protein